MAVGTLVVTLFDPIIDTFRMEIMLRITPECSNPIVFDKRTEANFAMAVLYVNLRVEGSTT